MTDAKKLEVILSYIPVIVTYNKIKTFDELVDTDRNDYPTEFIPHLDAIMSIFKRDGMRQRITRWIEDINRYGLTYEEAEAEMKYVIR